MRHVIIIGAGVAGTGAAIAAAAGALATVIDAGTGASTLSTGAIDVVPWTHTSEAAVSIPAEARRVLDVLGGYVLPDGGSLVLTSAGIVRRARGHDTALLDVAPLTNARIGVVRCGRPGWDADALARAWGSRYEPVDATVTRLGDERALPDADFAARHDDDDRLGWLADRLREALAQSDGTFSALVLPPALGVERARADALSKLIGLACGEAIGMPGGPSGLRFERGRDRALASAGVARVRERATKVGRAGGRWRVVTERGDTHEGDAVVLATGGLLGGGLEYAPSETMPASVLPPRARAPLRLAIDAPLALGSHGRLLEVPGSLFGVPPESLASPFAHDALFDRAGVLVDEHGAATGVTERDLFAAGEIVADEPRTWLGALCSGVRAGAAAARESLQRGAEARSIA
ncbi:MAG: FAD/NAD(P)-binding protein [Polyangiaceae bacterium]